MNQFLFSCYFLFFSSILTLGQSIEKDTTHLPEASVFYQPGMGGEIQKIRLDSQAFFSSTLGDLLEKNSSVFINSYGVSGLQSISIRGTGSMHTTVYWNGLSIQSPTLGMVDFSTINPTALGNLEIHLGASSLVDGSGGLGGSIQLTDDLKYDSLVGASLQTGFGSFGKSYRKLLFNWANTHWSTMASVYDVDAPNRFAFVNPTKPGFPIDTLKNASSKLFSSKVGVGYRWNQKVNLNAFLWYNSSWRELPRSITSSDFGEDYQTDFSLRSVVNLSVNFQRFIHQFSVGNIRDELRYFADFNSIVKTQSFQGNYRQTAYLSSFFKIKSAVEFSRTMANSGGFVNRVYQNKAGVMINPQWKWKDKLTADFIFRIERYDRTFSLPMPSLLLNFSLSKVFNLRATAAKIYRHPTFNEWYWTPGGNPNLKPENGTSFELGVDFLTKSRIVEANLTGFYSEIDNWVIWIPHNSYSIPINLLLVKSHGVDLRIDFHKKITEKWMLNSKVNYSYVVSKNYNAIADGTTGQGKQLTYVPRNKLNVGISVLKNNYWQLSYQYRFTDKRFIVRDHSRWMPYFMISDVALKYYFRQMRWVDFVSVSINNVLDKNYEVLPYRPMMGRNVMVDLRFEISR